MQGLLSTCSGCMTLLPSASLINLAGYGGGCHYHAWSSQAGTSPVQSAQCTQHRTCGEHLPQCLLQLPRANSSCVHPTGKHHYSRLHYRCSSCFCRICYAPVRETLSWLALWQHRSLATCIGLAYVALCQALLPVESCSGNCDAVLSAR